MAKKSRRVRRQETEKQRQDVLTGPPVAAPPASVARPMPAPVMTPAVTPPPKAVEIEPLNRKTVNFAREYFYVYKELRNILIISVLMFIVMVSLSFVI